MYFLHCNWPQKVIHFVCDYLKMLRSLLNILSSLLFTLTVFWRLTSTNSTRSPFQRSTAPGIKSLEVSNTFAVIFMNERVVSCFSCSRTIPVSPHLLASSASVLASSVTSTRTGHRVGFRRVWSCGWESLLSKPPLHPFPSLQVCVSWGGGEIKERNSREARPNSSEISAHLTLQSIKAWSMAFCLTSSCWCVEMASLGVPASRAVGWGWQWGSRLHTWARRGAPLSAPPGFTPCPHRFL